MDFPPLNFPPVAPDEMGFALTLFVNAANRRISSRTKIDPAFRPQARTACDALYRSLCGEPGGYPSLGRMQTEETTLEEAFRVLCEHYEIHAQQVSICARVLGFYFLMERSAGAILAGWVQPCPESPNLVLLAPEVVAAIATVKLDATVLLKTSKFLELVQEMASLPQHRSR